MTPSNDTWHQLFCQWTTQQHVCFFGRNFQIDFRMHPLVTTSQMYLSHIMDSVQCQTWWLNGTFLAYYIVNMKMCKAKTVILSESSVHFNQLCLPNRFPFSPSFWNILHAHKRPAIINFFCKGYHVHFPRKKNQFGAFLNGVCRCPASHLSCK